MEVEEERDLCVRVCLFFQFNRLVSGRPVGLSMRKRTGIKILVKHRHTSSQKYP